MIVRRRDIIAFAAIAWPLAARAQQPKMRRIGFLRVGQPPPAFIDGFRQGLRELGLIEGVHFVIEYGLAQSAAQIPDTAAALVGRGIELLVASGTPSVFPARNAAGELPVVFIATLDPVKTGLVPNLARPGRNLTGTTSISGDIIAKRLQLIKEVVPGLGKIAVLVRGSSPTTPQYLSESRAAARNLGLELQVLSELQPGELGALLAAARGSGALVIADDAEFTARRVELAETAIKHRLPTISGLKELAQAGGLMAYGASFAALYRRAASQVYKILEGARPGDLPVEQPTTFELVINLKTARALGLTVAQSLLARADEVIE